VLNASTSPAPCRCRIPKYRGLLKHRLLCKGSDFSSMCYHATIHTLSTVKLLWRFENTRPAPTTHQGNPLQGNYSPGESPAGELLTRGIPCRGTTHQGNPLQGNYSPGESPAGELLTRGIPCRGTTHQGNPLQGNYSPGESPAGELLTRGIPCRGLLTGHYLLTSLLAGKAQTTGNKKAFTKKAKAREWVNPGKEKASLRRLLLDESFYTQSSSKVINITVALLK